MTHQQHRDAFVPVNVTVAHRAAVEDQRVIQQVPLAVRRVLQLVEEVRQHSKVIAVDLGLVLDRSGLS